MKKGLILINLLCLFFLLGCSIDFNITPKQNVQPTEGQDDAPYEDGIDDSQSKMMSDEELLAIYYSDYRLPDDYADLLNYDLNCDVRSASTLDEAIANAEDRVTHPGFASGHHPVGTSVATEQEYYYIVNVSWTAGGSHIYNMDFFCFKEEYVHHIAPIAYRDIEFAMNIKDLSKIKVILDLYECVQIFDISGFAVLNSEIEETSDGYLYTDYQVRGTQGDFDTRDHVNLVQRTFHISKEDGKVSFLEEKTMQIAYGELR